MGILDEPLRLVAATVFGTVLGSGVTKLVRQPKSADDYDPLTGERFEQPPTPYEIHLLVENYDRRYIDGKAVLAGDVRGTFPASEVPFLPSPELDTIQRLNPITQQFETLRIISVSSNLLDQAITHELQLRGA
jgi:hypothetical protein